MQSAQLSTARVLRSKKNFVGIFVFWEMVCYTIFNIGRVGCCSGLQVLDSVRKQADTAMYEQKKAAQAPAQRVRCRHDLCSKTHRRADVRLRGTRPGAEVLVDVTLVAPDGVKRVLPYPDAALAAADINEGDTAVLTSDGLLKKV